MLSRRIAASAVRAPLAAGLVATSQKRFDHDRWYGHVMETDIWNYKHTNTKPKWMRPDVQSTEETEVTKKNLPHIDFATSYEALLFDADRLNPHLNRKEFGNETKARLEKQSNIVARSQHLVRESKYKDVKLEDRQIARIADEEHIAGEMKYVKCIRANEMTEDNRLDILPGGSPNSLREKTRWNMNYELHPTDRKEITIRLMAWLPEKYHIVYFDDFQTVAANDATCRKEMLSIVDAVAKEHAAEADASGYKEDLNEIIGELREDVDPTRDITVDKIKASSSLDDLEAWSRKIHEYNGDDRLLLIYERAAAITKNEKHAALVKKLRQWAPKTKSYATAQ
jgi:hypothetical protein